MCRDNSKIILAVKSPPSAIYKLKSNLHILFHDAGTEWRTRVKLLGDSAEDSKLQPSNGMQMDLLLEL